MGARMWITWTLLAVFIILIVVGVLGHRAMIAVKPRVDRAGAAAPSEEIASLQARLMSHVQVLGGVIGERHLGRPDALRAAAAYIRTAWARHGLSVSEESFEVGGQAVMNLVVEQRGASAPQEIVVVGAHYDTAPGTPGANDNGTGVALLLEMARVLKDEALSRTIRYVAFVNEEPPHFFTERMGSRVHARSARQRGDNIVAMLSLETLGYYSSVVGSQAYPFPFGLFYPHTGNFLAVVGNLPSRALVVEFLAQFMTATDFPVEGVATFGWVPGINWSDHWSFWREGYPAIMLTDTAPFRYPFYHGDGDIPLRITAPEYARGAHGIIHAVRALAETPKEFR